MYDRISDNIDLTFNSDMVIGEENLRSSFIFFLEKNGWSESKLDAFFENNHEKNDRQIIFREHFKNAFFKLNPDFSNQQFEQLLYEIKLKIDNYKNDLKKLNKFLLEKIVNGWRIGGTTNSNETKNLVKLIDLDNAENNNYYFIKEFCLPSEKNKNRADLVLFVNGLPLILIELKSPFDPNSSCVDGWKQIKRYSQETSIFFYFNLFSIVSDGNEFRYGDFGNELTHWWPWTKESADSKVDFKDLNLEEKTKVFVKGLLNKKVVCNLLKHFFFFTDQKKKIIASYHQYFAVEKINRRLQNITDGRGGVVWHTQGSGKTITMVFLTKLLLENEPNKTIILITDRNQLDSNLYQSFTKTKFMTDVKQFESSTELKRILSNRKSGGIYFTTIQKFKNDGGILSERRDILVIADEAHRSHYGIFPRIDWIKEKNHENIREVYGYAKRLRKALPYATYLGFTATPLDKKDKSTYKIFGPLIDCYGMLNALNDKVTVKIVYKHVPVPLKRKGFSLDQDWNEIKEKIKSFDEQNALNSERIKLRKLLGNVELAFQDDDRINQIKKEFWNHYQQISSYSKKMKALFVAHSRKVGLKFFKALNSIIELKGKVVLIVSGDRNDKEKELIDAARNAKQNIKNFQDPKSETTIAIVVDMLLTGFDMPTLELMYIDKWIHSHTLLQAMARVNRSFPGKTRGLVVSFVNLKDEIYEAVKENSRSGNIPIETIDQLLEKVDTYLNRLDDLVSRCEVKSILRDLFSSFEWENYQTWNWFDLYQKLGSKEKLPFASRLSRKITEKNESSKKQFLEDVRSLERVSKYIPDLHQNNKTREGKTKLFIAIANYYKKENSKNIDNVLKLDEIRKTWNEFVEKQIILQNKNDPIYQETTEEFILDVESFNKYIALINSQYKNEHEIQNRMSGNILKDNLKHIKKYMPTFSIEIEDKLDTILDKYNKKQITAEMAANSKMELMKNLLNKTELVNNFSYGKRGYASFEIIRKDGNFTLSLREAVPMIKEIRDKFTLVNKKEMDWCFRTEILSEIRFSIRKIFKSHNYPKNLWQIKSQQILDKEIELEKYGIN